MRRIYTVFLALFLTSCLLAQAPQQISYQCVVRNASGVLVTNQSVGIRISILQGTSTGTVVFQETYNPDPQTNANGLVTVQIGGGTLLAGTFSTINWASGPYFLKTETDPAGGTNYTISGTSQLLSVPYAIYSRTAQTADYNNLTNLPNLSGYITSESDPLFASSPSFGISGINISNWNAAFGWGNHANAGYLTGLTEAWKKNGGNIYYNTGFVGIGTDSPTSPLTVSGIATVITSIKTPAILPLDGIAASINIKTNNASNADAGDISIISGSNSSPFNGYGRGGDVTVAGGDFSAPNPTGGSSSRAGNVSLRGGATPNGGGGVGFPGNIFLNGGEGGTNARGGAIVLQAGSGNAGGNINLTAGAGVGPGIVYITGGTSTTLNLPGNVVISGGNVSGGGAYGNIIFNTGASQQAIIDNLGNFGIGTTSPVTKLDVNGIITSTGGNSANWNSAFGWGNHASAGYLTSFTELDPKVGSVSTGYSAKWNGTALVTGAVYQDNSGNVGIGTTSPGFKLEVTGNVKMSGSSAATAGLSVIGPTLGGPPAIEGISGLGSSVKGQLGTSGGAGVSGTSNSGTGAGVYGEMTSGGLATSSGVYGRVTGAVGSGVYGEATSATGINFGVYGKSSSPAGWGLYTPNNMFAGGKVSIGTASTTSNLQVAGLQIFANNAAAIAGGLAVGAFYRTGGDPDFVCVVH